MAKKTEKKKESYYERKKRALAEMRKRTISGIRRPLCDENNRFPNKEETLLWRKKRFASMLGIVVDEYNEMAKTEELIYSEYEGYALFLDELQKLWLETIKEPKKRDVKKLRKAAARIGAMSIRYINSITGLE